MNSFVEMDERLLPCLAVAVSCVSLYVLTMRFDLVFHCSICDVDKLFYTV